MADEKENAPSKGYADQKEMKAWDTFVDALEKEIGKESTQKWLRTLRVVQYDACNLYLEAADSFQAAWFEEHIRPRAKNFVNSNQRQIKIHLSSKEASEKRKVPPSFSLSIAPDELHPHFTFSHFVETKENLVATRLLSDIGSAGAFNPLFFYGGKGVGKTHLLMAAARKLQEKNLRVFFVNAETFTGHVVAAIRLGKMEVFRNTYRHIDALCIDDIHIFGRKAATQEEFFHTFNTLHTLGKQILLTANVSASELSDIEPRLISRFEWGLSLHLVKSSPEEYRKILESKMSLFQLHLPEESIQFLLHSFPHSKDLAHAVETIALKSRLSPHLPLSLPSIQEFLKDLVEKGQKEALSPAKILKAVSDEFGLKVSDLQGKGQNREISVPRQIAMHLCRIHLKMPLMKIGDLFERDHSTVMTAIKQAEKMRESGEGKEKILRIEKRLE